MRLPAALIALALTGFITTSQFWPDVRRTVAIELAVPNDNRTPAGTLSNGVLTVRLELRAVEWKPDADNAPGVQILAFAEEGRTPSVPGPLLRVKEGTEIRASIRNTQTGPLVVHGLYARPAAAGPRPGYDRLRTPPPVCTGKAPLVDRG